MCCSAVAVASIVTRMISAPQAPQALPCLARSIKQQHLQQTAASSLALRAPAGFPLYRPAAQKMAARAAASWQVCLWAPLMSEAWHASPGVCLAGDCHSAREQGVQRSLACACASSHWSKQTSEQVEPPRSGHCAAALPAEHEGDVLVFGGYTEDSQGKRQASGDAWVYSCSKGAWSQLQYAAGPVPRVRLVSL